MQRQTKANVRMYVCMCEARKHACEARLVGAWNKLSAQRMARTCIPGHVRGHDRLGGERQRERAGQPQAAVAVVCSNTWYLLWLCAFHLCKRFPSTSVSCPPCNLPTALFTCVAELFLIILHTQAFRFTFPSVVLLPLNFKQVML